MIDDQHPLEMLVLNAAFDAGGAISLAALRDAVPATSVEIRKAITRQGQLGNLKRHVEGEPVALTASARAAIAAGRAHRPMMIVEFPARRCGKKLAATLETIALGASLPAAVHPLRVAMRDVAAGSVPGGFSLPSGTASSTAGEGAHA